MFDLLMLACLALASAQDPLESVPTRKTKHYDLVLDVTSAQREDCGKLVEAAWEAYRAELGRKPRTKPGKKPIVRLFPSRSTWLAGMEHEQEFPIPGVNFVHYSPKRNTLYLHQEPNVYHARKMFLYGLFLQFHYQLKSKNQYLGQEWFVTGMGDALSTHRWDGETLELGSQLLLTADNRAHLAIQRGVLDKLTDGELSADDLSDWDVRWALTAFLLNGQQGAYRSVFQKLALGSRGSMMHGIDFLSGIGDSKIITAQIEAWVRARGHVLEAVHGKWQERGFEVIGTTYSGQDFALALSDPTTLNLEAGLTSQTSTGAGFVLDWQDGQNYTVALLRDYILHVWLITPKGHREIDIFDLRVPRGRSVRLRAEFRDDESSLIANGRELGRYPAASRRLGLVTHKGRAAFRRVLTQ